MYRIIFVIIIVVLNIHFSIAQLSISGQVIDAKSGDPLSGATVQIWKGPTTVSDQFGHFRFEKISAGESRITVSYVGFTSFFQEWTLSTNEEITVRLEPASIMTEAVVVTATRAGDKTPATFSTVTREAIQKQNFGQDVPFLLNWSPSVVTTSDAGTGIGYTGIRIRGSDATRINVTINGIPYNDSESLGTFWVDIPDIASSTQSIQIQRGVGTSTNGAGAFGASINLQTNTRNELPYGEIITSTGSFGTWRHTLGFGTGVLSDHWIVEGRVSNIRSDGFIDRATSDLSSHYFSAGYYSGNTMIKGIYFGGKEKTYQAWYGVPESRLKNDPEAMEITAVNEGWNEIQTQNLLSSGSRTFNPYLYKNQVDNYGQDHFQLHFTQRFNRYLSWNTSLHYTIGKGYYEEYRYDDEFGDYGLGPVIIGDSVITSSDLIRRRWLDNDFYGFTYSLIYEKNDLSLIVGGGLNRYDGDHFGEILWAEVTSVPLEYRYYFNHGDKRDFNSFIKASYNVTDRLSAFADVQIRSIQYDASGLDNGLTPIQIKAHYDFFNPKAGLTFSADDNRQLYIFGGIGNREPVREDFLGFGNKNPKHESLTNFELGYKMNTSGFLLHTNLYLMSYRNQLVLTGELNDVGAPVRTNAGESYRLGVETETAVRFHKNLQWNGNLTLSRNKIRSYVEVLEDYGPDFDQYNIVRNEYKNTDVSFSPAIIAGSQISWKVFANADIALLSKYVGKQYLDNTMNESRALDAYFVNDVRLSYLWKPGLAKEIRFSFMVNNLLDHAYESNGYTWGYLAGPAAYRENYSYPQAGRNYMGMISIRL